MAVNYENVLYPEEAVLEYQSNLLDIYTEDYGEEHRDIIEERIRNTLYLFDANPITTYEMLYDYAERDLVLAKRMSDEVANFTKMQNKAIKKFRKYYIDLLSKTFNVRHGARRLLDLDFSFILDKSISEEDYFFFDEIYRKKCKSLGISPIYDVESIKALNSSEEMLNKCCDLYVLENSLWGKRIIGNIREKFGNLPTEEILEILKSATFPNLATSTQILDSGSAIGSILYFPLVCMLDIGDIDHNFVHESRHIIETGDNGCGLKTMQKGLYRLINELHTEDNAIKDSKRLNGKIIWSQDEAAYRNLYQDLFPYTADFFDGYRDLLSFLALYNNTELLEEIFGEKELLEFEKFLQEIERQFTLDADFYRFGEIYTGKKLVKKLDDNARRYFTNVD